jgi:hypothetical protein
MRFYGFLQNRKTASADFRSSVKAQARFPTNP